MSLLTTKRRPKYRNVPTDVGGFSFPSKREANRYGELVLLERAGHIRELTLQPRYALAVNGLKIATYVGDFQYYRLDDEGVSRPITEDIKGVLTPVFKLKAKLFRAIYGREIELT